MIKTKEIGYVVEDNITGNPENPMWSAISTPLDSFEKAREFAESPFCVGASHLRIVLVYEIENSER